MASQHGESNALSERSESKGRFRFILNADDGIVVECGSYTDCDAPMGLFTSEKPITSAGVSLDTTTASPQVIPPNIGQFALFTLSDMKPGKLASHESDSSSDGRERRKKR